MRRLVLMLSLAVGAAAAQPLGAQTPERSFSPPERSGSRGQDKVPPGHMPPPGMCRIWIDGVPPGQQPAPTDCATAVRNRPANGRVIFGDEPKDKGARFKPRPLRPSDRDTVPDDPRPADERKRPRKP